MIQPIILAGGTGTRLWPISRKSYPKQFVAQANGSSLYQSTLNRLSCAGFLPPLVVTNEDYRFIAIEQAENSGVIGARIVVEPVARNTAPAVLTAALMLADQPETVMLVAPTDHCITDDVAFVNASKVGEAAANKGAIVLFGVQPDRAATSYGYLELEGRPSQMGDAFYDVSAFVEKPDKALAESMIEAGHHLWNAGMFMFRVDTILEAFEIHAPALFLPCRAALTRGRDDLSFHRLDEDAYARCNSISLDYAIMEHVDDLLAMPLDCGWADLGGWKSLHRIDKSGPDDNTLSGNTMAFDCKNSLLRSDNDSKMLVGLGLRNIAAVATDDAVLVVDLDCGEQLPQVLEVLKAGDHPQAEEFLRNYRPWGYYETLSLGPRFQVKRIMVKPKAQLSLQSHVHRAEHWVVVEGSALVTVGSEERLITENESTYIPLGEIHRLENPGKLPLHLIEVQSGSYLGEDDITRYEDIYDRIDVA